MQVYLVHPVCVVFLVCEVERHYQMNQINKTNLTTV